MRLRITEEIGNSYISYRLYLTLSAKDITTLLLCVITSRLWLNKSAAACLTAANHLSYECFLTIRYVTRLPAGDWNGNKDGKWSYFGIFI